MKTLIIKKVIISKNKIKSIIQTKISKIKLTIVNQNI